VSNTSQSVNQSTVLGAFVNVIGLLSIALYFTGWIYRWAYYDFFRIELNALNLPAQSFFFVPLSVLIGSFAEMVIALILIIGIALSVILTWFFIDWIVSRVRVHRSLTTLLKDLVVVASVLLILYSLARSQGQADAKRDAATETSLLPVITIVQPEKDLGLGRNPKKLTDEPALQKDPAQQKTRIIGNVDLFRRIQRIDIKAPGDNPKSGDWRLLVNSSGWLYLVRTLPKELVQTKDKSPLILAVREGGGEQVMILGPIKALDSQTP
jgi:hypothetical protein